MKSEGVAAVRLPVEDVKEPKHLINLVYSLIHKLSTSRLQRGEGGLFVCFGFRLLDKFVHCLKVFPERLLEMCFSHRLLQTRQKAFCGNDYTPIKICILPNPTGL